MILFEEHRGVFYTIESWDLLSARVIISIFSVRPDIVYQENVVIARAFAIDYINNVLKIYDPT